MIWSKQKKRQNKVDLCYGIIVKRHRETSCYAVAVAQIKFSAFLFGAEGGSVDENQNAIKYAAIYSMIMSLLKKGKIDMEEAEEINLCCAVRLDCKALTLEE